MGTQNLNRVNPPNRTWLVRCRLDPNLYFIFRLIFACLSAFMQGAMCAEASFYVAFPFLPWRNIPGAVDHPYVSDDDDVDDCLYQVLHEPQGSAFQLVQTTLRVSLFRVSCMPTRNAHDL
jgi:hypothetical protein